MLPDMPRALSRLALGRGGPRDLARYVAGPRGGPRRRIVPREIDGCRRNWNSELEPDIRSLPPILEQRLAEMLAEDLPLLKRDGGFMREGAMRNSTRVRALRDQSRRVIAGTAAAICRRDRRQAP
jgi:DNA mismatch repair protein MutS